MTPSTTFTSLPPLHFALPITFIATHRQINKEHKQRKKKQTSKQNGQLRVYQHTQVNERMHEARASCITEYRYRYREAKGITTTRTKTE